MYNKKGSLVVRTLTAGGALPVAGAIVRIHGTDKENNTVDYSLRTGDSGETARVELPAPEIENSLTPLPSGPVCSTYSVEFYAEGYYPERLFSIEIFDGIAATQSIGLVPLAFPGDGSPLLDGKGGDAV